MLAGGLKLGGQQGNALGGGLGTTGGLGGSLGGGIGGLGTATSLGGGLGGTSTGLGTGLGTTGGLGTLGQANNPGLKLNLGGGLQNTSTGLNTGLGTTGLGTTGLGTTSLGTGLGGTSLGTTGLGTTGLGGTSLGGGLGGTSSALKLGGGLGQPASTSLGGLGLNKPAGLGMFNNQTQQQSALNRSQLMAQQALNTHLTLSAIKPPGPSVFGDERDLVLMQFNWLQACCGTGKGLVNYEGATRTVDFTPDSLLCRFKTICYNRLPSARNKDGLVALQFKKKCDDLIPQQEAIVQGLQSLVSKSVPNSQTEVLQVICDSIRPLPDDCSEMTIYLQKKSGMLTQRLLATDVQQFLQHASRKAQLEGLGVSAVYAKTGFSEESLKLYLQNPPPGVSSQLWEQSKKDNPDPKKYIPVPVVGSAALLARMKHQDQECKQQQSRLEILTGEIANLLTAHTTAMARAEEYRRKLGDLSHRVLRLMVRQEVLRKRGCSVQPSEEPLRARLEGIQVELDAPLQFKGRLNELMAQLRMQTQVPGARISSSYPADPLLIDDIKRHLSEQQGALTQLVDIIKEDNDDLDCVKDGFEQT